MIRIGIALGALVACSRSTPAPTHEPTLETVVVELKDVAPPEPPKVEVPAPADVAAAVPEAAPPKQRTKTKARPQPRVSTKPADKPEPQPEVKPAEPPKPDTKPPLETNPYIYK